jgi:hypothetical protein
MVRVFVNANGVDVPAGATALEAVREWSSDAAQEVAAGARLITDSRGLPIDAATAMNAGSILRLVANRAAERDAERAADGGADEAES